MKHTIRRRAIESHAVTCLFAISLSVTLIACKENAQAITPSSVPASTTEIGVFIAGSVPTNTQSNTDIRAKVLWPAKGKFDLRKGPEPIAGELINLDPDWGSYMGAGQSQVDDGPIFNHLDLVLTSRNAVDNLVQFVTAQGYMKPVIVVYAKGDSNASRLKYEEIVDKIGAQP